MPPPPRIPDDVRQWIERQDASERDELARTWATTGLAEAPMPAADTDAVWARLDALLDDDDAPVRRARPPVPTASRRSPSARFGRIAAVAALAVAVAATFALWPRTATLVAGDRVLTASLPDGSTVTLAPGSTLRHREGLRGDGRTVALDGQGFFAVATAERPFVVETGNAAVEVLGTEFDVSAWAGTDETAVALVEGSVRFRSAAGAVTLDPGEVSRVVGRGAPTPPVAADVEAVAAWRAGGFSVVDAPLAAVAAALEARFGCPVRIGPSVDGGRRLTLYLPSADSADAVLRDVAAYLDLRVQSGPDGYAVLPR
jgi:ferric-dicitrate binding protein FerR (iron transport regulator)